MTEILTYRPIGVIRSPFRGPRGMPIQASFAANAVGTVELEPEYAPGLKDLEGLKKIVAQAL